MACTSTEEPLAPTTPNPQSAAAAVPLKVTEPKPVSPPSDKLDVGSTEVVLTSTASTPLFADPKTTLTYEFQVFNPSGAMVADYPVPSPTATVDVSGLPVSTRHTWRTRAVFQGNFGPWSRCLLFRDR